jgi:exodeoxyribonuclease VII large subunit
LRIQGEGKQLLSREGEKVRTTALRIQHSVNNGAKQEKSKLEQRQEQLQKGLHRFIKLQQDNLFRLETGCRQLDPNALLQKGYTRTESKGKPIHQLTLAPGDQILTHTSTQKISSTIQTIESK